MKSVIVLFLSAVFCTADATFLNILLLQVRNARSTVEKTIQQLEQNRDNVKQDVDLAVVKTWSKQMEEYNKYADPVLDKIRKEVEDAKAKGKDAQRCYDAALNILKNIDYQSRFDARRCRESAKLSISNNLDFIDRLITTGQELIEELDNIFPDCYEKNSRLIEIIKLHRCISNQLAISKINVKNLKTDASSAKSTAKNAASVVLQESTECLSNAYSTAHSGVKEAREAATRCLNNLP